MVTRLTTDKKTQKFKDKTLMKNSMAAFGPASALHPNMEKSLFHWSNSITWFATNAEGKISKIAGQGNKD